jgi:hypothetical protein
MSGPRDLAEAEQLADQLAEESRYAGVPREPAEAEDEDWDWPDDDDDEGGWWQEEDDDERPIVNVPGGDLL